MRKFDSNFRWMLAKIILLRLLFSLMNQLVIDTQEIAQRLGHLLESVYGDMTILCEDRGEKISQLQAHTYSYNQILNSSCHFSGWHTSSRHPHSVMDC